MEVNLPTDAIRLEQHAHVLFDIDERGRIIRLNEPDPETEPPLAFLARGRASSLLLFRAEASDDIVSAFTTAVAGLGPWTGHQADGPDLDPVRRAVGLLPPDRRESHGPAFDFRNVRVPDVHERCVVIDRANAHLLDANFPYTRSVLDQRAPVVGIVRDGAVVSACYSARRRRDTAEAGVHTIEPYQRQGFGVAVVSAWALAASAAGMTPLYSTAWDNTASLRVAARLGLDAYADTLSIG